MNRPDNKLAASSSQKAILSRGRFLRASQFKVCLSNLLVDNQICLLLYLNIKFDMAHKISLTNFSTMRCNTIWGARWNSGTKEPTIWHGRSSPFDLLYQTTKEPASRRRRNALWMAERLVPLLASRWPQFDFRSRPDLRLEWKKWLFYVTLRRQGARSQALQLRL
jgi:hypothetical protein